MRAFGLIFLAILLFYAAGCATYRSGGQTKRGETLQYAPKFTLGIVEFDDQGWLRDRADAARIINEVSREAERGGATIVVFVHGWHHDARSDDANLACFKKSLERLHDELELPVYRIARERLFGPNASNRVVGLYVGWRGRSLPASLDYATFWDRKSAAARVGHGDITEFFTRLDSIFKQNNFVRPTGTRFTGLVTIGHSFGAQVVFAGVADTVKHRLSKALPLGREERNAVGQTIEGFGDLVVLVNPALESSVYHAIDQLTRLQQFRPEQTPILLTISSEADGPNQSLFPFGRFVSVPFQPFGSAGQFAQKLHSLGNYRPQITHCLALQGGTPCAGMTNVDVPRRQVTQPSVEENVTPRRLPSVATGCDEPIELDPSDAEANAGVWGIEDLLDPSRIQLAGKLGMLNTRLWPVEEGIDPNNPFLLVKCTRAIVRGHNDIFNPTLIDFIVRYAAGAELKRVAVERQNASERVATQGP